MPTINSLDMESLRALSRALDTIKYQLRDVREQQARLNRESAPAQAYVCGTSTAIEAFNDSTNVPGSGTALIYQRRGSNTTPTSGGVLTSTGISITVFNLSTVEIAEGQWIMVKRDAFGDYWVDFQNCE